MFRFQGNKHPNNPRETFNKVAAAEIGPSFCVLRPAEDSDIVEEEEIAPREDLHAKMHATEMGPTTEESILSLSLR
jgi:hypothetical protein